MKYAAFLRGINVGGNTIVSMKDLGSLFESVGFRGVKTLLNSGNVVFETEEKDADKLARNIEEKLEKKFGRVIKTVLRGDREIMSLIAADPFGEIVITPSTRFNVTFLSNQQGSSLKIPYEPGEKDFKIVCMIGREVCWIVDIASKKGTSDVMKIIEKEFGKNVTTRTWNTVIKIGALLAETAIAE